ncbi:hypothetical protein [Vibrio xiamenensis]|uniref:hypothetical protein n=1 Tax=Vibrio xiamenensis TaxID=861298 RepID=UPI000A893901|nr:hypothetical protein [Vibrio xiamenensis]
MRQEKQTTRYPLGNKLKQLLLASYYGKAFVEGKPYQTAPQNSHKPQPVSKEAASAKPASKPSKAEA